MSELSLATLRGCFLELRLLDQPVLVHASLKAFGYIQGGADTLVRALVETTAGVVAPTFTYKTMITPEVGPPNNGISYGTDLHLNSMAESFREDMPTDPMMGILPEAVRLHPAAHRTAHPILSFAGIHAEAALEAQTMFSPLEPIGALAGQDGWVLLLGTDHTVNTSIHYGEMLAGRRQFVRWALLKNRVVECPGYPGDSSGFRAIAQDLELYTRRAQLGRGMVEAVPIKRVLEATQARLAKDPLDLLCRRPDCERCSAIRETGGV
jgi:aminoglycoside 3-N-acetyltransferase